jgi:hypothetical protein
MINEINIYDLEKELRCLRFMTHDAPHMPLPDSFPIYLTKILFRNNDIALTHFETKFTVIETTMVVNAP